jgi:hypothetical protein
MKGTILQLYRVLDRLQIQIANTRRQEEMEVMHGGSNWITLPKPISSISSSPHRNANIPVWPILLPLNPPQAMENI